MKEIRNILVGVNLNDWDEPLLTSAENFASRFGSKIWLVHVAAPDPDFVGYEPGPQYVRDVRAEKLRNEHRELSEISEDLKSRGIESEGLLIQGPTIQMLLEEAEKLETDLLIVGTHKHGFWDSLFSESVSVELLRKSQIPLLAIPTGEE